MLTRLCSVFLVLYTLSYASPQLTQGEPILIVPNCTNFEIARPLSIKNRQIIAKEVSRRMNLKEKFPVVIYNCFLEMLAYLDLTNPKYYKYLKKKKTIVRLEYKSFEKSYFPSIAKSAAKYWKAKLRKMDENYKFGCNFVKKRGHQNETKTRQYYDLVCLFSTDVSIERNFISDVIGPY